MTASVLRFYSEAKSCVLLEEGCRTQRLKRGVGELVFGAKRSSYVWLASKASKNRVSESPHANYIQSTMDVQKVMGLARKVITGKQPDWNVVTKEMPISPYLLQTYNIVLPLSNFARTLTGGERGKSHEDGGTKPTDPFMPPQSDGATDGVIPTQTSGTDT
ncbi:acyltransferase [Sesbania bispinosa]|nr:acyltransferase [Sesbania bispinosa]